MGDKLSLEDVDETLKHFKHLSHAVDELVRQRAAEGPFVLPSATFFSKHADSRGTLEASDLLTKPPRTLPNALARTQGPQGVDAIPPYPHALAAAAEVARATSADSTKRGVLKASTHPMHHVSLTQDMQPRSKGCPHAPGSTGGTSPAHTGGSALAAGVQALLALPGQLPYRKLLAAAQKSRAPESQAFAQELNDLDDEIDSYLAADRSKRTEPGAALLIQSAWRAVGPRLLFNRYMHQRRSAQLRTLSQYLGPLRQLVKAVRHQRQRLVHTAFLEWKALGDLKLLLFKKVLLRLKASMIDVRDSQSPNHLWRLCTAPGEDPWTAKIGLGALCRNLIQAQFPWRKLRLYFSSWRGAVREVAGRRARAVAVLSRAERGRTWDTLHMLFRFWYRWAMVKLSERLNISAPLFRPRLDVWDTWLWEHMRSNELRGRIALLHQGFRMRHCFQFWKGFAARNRKLRQACMSAAVPQIEALMRYALGCLKAHWLVARAQRRMRNAAFREWLRLARRNVLVRRIARTAEHLSRMSIKKLVIRRMREWCNMSKLLNAAATIQMLQRRPLCMVPLCAWTGDDTNMWFVAAWHAWRNFAVGRIRMRCWLAQHLHLAPCLSMELAFKAWRKVTELQVEHSDWVTEQLEQRDERKAAREITMAALTAQSCAVSRGVTPSAAERPSIKLNPGSTTTSIRCRSSRNTSFAGGWLVPAAASSRPGTAGEGGTLLTAAKRAQMIADLAAEEEADNRPLEEELAEGSVQVTCADFPPAPLWRGIVSASSVLQLADESTSGVNPAAITNLVWQLAAVEGRFLPDTDSNTNDARQLVLEADNLNSVDCAVQLCERQEVTPAVRRLLDDDTEHQFSLWLDGGTGPDPWLWQRLVGLALCSATPHPEAPCGPLVDHMALPWAAEVGHLRLKQTLARLHVPIVRENGEYDGSGGECEPSAEEVLSPRVLAKRAARQRQGLPLQFTKAEAKYAGVFTEDEQELIWLHRLALSEQLLEGCVGRLLNVGHHVLPSVYETLRQMAPRASNVILKQGDLLVHVLEGALHHDCTFMAAAKQYRANRDRVITMGMSLHKHAMALNTHCPEFSLTYPTYNPTSTWKDAMDLVDQEDPDAPPPPRPKPQTDLIATNESTTNQKLPVASHVSISQAVTAPVPASPGRSGPVKNSGSWRPGGALLKPTTMSTSERIKMEMMGLTPPSTAPMASPKTGTRTREAPRSPPGTSPPSREGASGPMPATTAGNGGTATPPRATTPPAAPAARVPDPNTKAQDAEPVPIVAEVTSSAVASPGGIVLPQHKPLSLEDVQSRGVVLGAAAAAILAAKAAAAKRALGGHRVNPAEVAQILSKPTPYKNAWRPSGYRKVEGKAKDGTSHTPKAKRLPPLPVLRTPSPKPQHYDDEDEYGSQAPETGGGSAAGDAAFRAMMMHAEAGGPSHRASSPTRIGVTSVGLSRLGTAATGVGGAAQQQQQATVQEQQAGQDAAVRQQSSPTPTRPYLWFGPEGRLFNTVADIPKPVDAPSMHELHHRANRLNAERLESSLFNLPLLPAIIFSEWGNPPERSPSQARTRSPVPGATSRRMRVSMAGTSGPRVSMAGTAGLRSSMRASGVGLRTGASVSVTGGSSFHGSARQTDSPGSMAEEDDLAEDDDEAQAGGASRVASPVSRQTSGGRSLSAEARERLNQLDVSGLITLDRGSAPDLYRQDIGERLLSDSTTPRRVSDIGAVTVRLDEQAAAAALKDELQQNTEELDLSRLAYMQGRAARRRKETSEPATRPVFTVTPEQLNIYLGGHMRRQMRPNDVDEPKADNKHLLSATEPATGPMVPDFEFDARFDVSRIVATSHTPRRLLLEGYDLKGELRDLMGSKTAAAILAGAEDALLGARKLSSEEQEAVNQELERLEAELAKGNRVRRRNLQTHMSRSKHRVHHAQPGGRRQSDSGAHVNPSDALLDSRSLPGDEDATASGNPSSSDRQVRTVSPSRFRQEDQQRQRQQQTEQRQEQVAVAGHQDQQQIDAFMERRQPRSASSRRDEQDPSASLGRNASSTRQTPAGDQPGQELARNDSHRASASALVRDSRAASRNADITSTLCAPHQQEQNELPSAETVAAAAATMDASRPDSVSPWVDDRAFFHDEGDMQLLRSASRTAGPNAAVPGSGMASARTEQSPRNGSGGCAAGAPTVAAVQIPHLAQAQRRLLTADASLIFPERPDRPATADSIMGAVYADSFASSTVQTPGRRGAEDQGFEISVYNSLSKPDWMVGALPDVGPDDAGSPANMFAHINAGGRRTRRKSNLRNAATVVAASPASQPEQQGNTQQHLPVDAMLVSVPEDVDEESALQLEALRAMWQSAPYTSSGTEPTFVLPHPDSEPAAAISQIINAAAEADWQRYEAAAGQLVEQLSAALSQRETLDRVSPLPLDGSQAQGSPLLASSPLGMLGGHAARQSSPPSRGRQAPPYAGPHQLQRALSIMEDSLAAAIDPDRLTGFDVSRYPDGLSDLMGRLVVAPMATRYLFWKKVQSISQLKQRVMEDRALEDQLRSLSWASTFHTGHCARPSGAIPPRFLDAHAAAAPSAAATGAPLGLVKPTGWSSGALALATARRVPWATAIPNEDLRPQAAVMPISHPITLRPRNDTPGGSGGFAVDWDGVDAPVVGNGPDVLPRLQQAVGVPPLTLDQLQQDASRGRQFFPPQGQEALAARLAALLEARRAAKAAAAVDDPHAGLLTNRSNLSIQTLDADETQVETLTNMTIALHKDLLARHHQRIGHSSNTLVPGKGHMAGWAPPAEFPQGYNGRDTFHDTPDPFTYPPRPRAGAVPNPLPQVTLKGAAMANIVMRRQEAEPLAHGMLGSGLSLSIAARPAVANASVAKHVPQPTGQGKPLPRAQPPLGPVACPPAYVASEAQPGNVFFVTPHEHAYVGMQTRMLDNAYVPGFALGSVQDQPGLQGQDSSKRKGQGQSAPQTDRTQGMADTGRGEDSREYVDGGPWTPSMSRRSTPFGELLATGGQVSGSGQIETSTSEQPTLPPLPFSGLSRPVSAEGQLANRQPSLTQPLPSLPALHRQSSCASTGLVHNQPSVLKRPATNESTRFTTSAGGSAAVEARPQSTKRQAVSLGQQMEQ